MKADDLSLNSLNYWVARCLGAEEGLYPAKQFEQCGYSFNFDLKSVLVFNGYSNHWLPSTEWKDGGEIIYKYRIGVLPWTDDSGKWRAEFNNWVCDGDTPLIAAMRVFVSVQSRLKGITLKEVL